MTSTPRVVWTRNRRREITQEIVNRHARDGLTVLDAGSRDGDTMKLLSNHCKPGRLVALDWHNTIRGNIEFMKCDLEQPLPFADESFDIVICNDVLEHVERKNQLMAELCRIAKERLIICLPNTQSLDYIFGLLRGKMSSKYKFNVEDGLDRHRWVTYFKANNKFISLRAQPYDLVEVYYVVKHGFLSTLGMLFKSRYVVFNQLYLLNKRKAPN